MVLTSTIFSCLSFIALAAAAPSRPRNILDKRATPLLVTLKSGAGNGVVKATVTNTGSEDLSLLKYGSLLSDQPIQKLNVYKGDEKLEFQGIKTRYNLNKLSADAYTTVKAGETIEKEIDISGLYNLPSEGPYRISSGGAFSYVPVPKGQGANTTDPNDDVNLATFRPTSIKSTGAVAYSAEPFEMKINHIEANKRSLVNQLKKRMVTSGCSGDHQASLNAALATTADLAAKAAEAAKSGDAAKFKEYFMTDEQTVRDNVAARLSAIAEAAGSVAGGSSGGSSGSSSSEAPADPAPSSTAAPVDPVPSSSVAPVDPPTPVTSNVVDPGTGGGFPIPTDGGVVVVTTIAEVPGGISTGVPSSGGNGGGFDFPGFPGFPGSDSNSGDSNDAAASGSATAYINGVPVDLGALSKWFTGGARIKPRQTADGGSEVTYYCEDPMNQCQPDVLAYTLPSQNVIANCPIYYSSLSADSDQCHGQDQWSTTLHEMTHATAIFSPGTEDNGYGYEAAGQLTAEQALANADTYALYAQALHLNC